MSNLRNVLPLWILQPWHFFLIKLSKLCNVLRNWMLHPRQLYLTLTARCQTQVMCYSSECCSLIIAPNLDIKLSKLYNVLGLWMLQPFVYLSSCQTSIIVLALSHIQYWELSGLTKQICSHMDTSPTKLHANPNPAALLHVLSVVWGKPLSVCDSSTTSCSLRSLR